MTQEVLDEIESIALIPNPTDSFDEVWMVVNRSNGRFIERMSSRINSVSCEGTNKVLVEDQIFMDSVLSYDTTFDISHATPTNIFEVFTDDAHGFSSGETVVLKCSGFDRKAAIDSITTSIKVNNWEPGFLVRGSSVFYDNEEPNKGGAGFTLKKMFVKLVDAPGTGKRRRFTVYKNDEPTNMVVQLNDSETEGNVTTNVVFRGVLQDYFYLREEIIDGAAQGRFSCSFLAETDEDKQIFLGNRMGGHILQGSPANSQSTMHGDSFWDDFTSGAGETRTVIVFSAEGTLKNMKVFIPQLDDDASQQSTINGFFPHAPDRYVDFDIRLNSSSFSNLDQRTFLTMQGADTYEESEDTEIDVTRGYAVACIASRSHSNHNDVDLIYNIEFHPANAGERNFVCHIDPTDNDNRFDPGTNHSYNPAGIEDEEVYSIWPMSGTIKNMVVNTSLTAPLATFPVTLILLDKGCDSTGLVLILPKL